MKINQDDENGTLSLDETLVKPGVLAKLDSDPNLRALKNDKEEEPSVLSTGPSVAKWWQLKYLWNFHPEPWGFMIQFDEYFFLKHQVG